MFWDFCELPIGHIRSITEEVIFEHEHEGNCFTYKEERVFLAGQKRTQQFVQRLKSIKALFGKIISICRWLESGKNI